MSTRLLNPRRRMREDSNALTKISLMFKSPSFCPAKGVRTLTKPMKLTYIPICLFSLIIPTAMAEPSPDNYAVQVTATVDATPSVTLIWPALGSVSDYSRWRKDPNTASWESNHNPGAHNHYDREACILLNGWTAQLRSAKAGSTK